MPRRLEVIALLHPSEQGRLSRLVIFASHPSPDQNTACIVNMREIPETVQSAEDIVLKYSNIEDLNRRSS
jgi:hypothetical protein